MVRCTWASLCVLLLAAGCAGEDVHEDFASLSAALSSAGPGDTVRVGPVRIAGGTLTVPAGVTLLGAGEGSTVLEAPAGSIGVVIHTDSTLQSRVSGVTVESGGTAGVLVIGGGAARLDHAGVVVTVGIGVGAEGVADLVLDDVTITGPVTPENATSQPLDPSTTDSATHGLALVNVAAAALTRVHTDGFALFGALFVDSGVTWNEGGAEGNMGTGVMSYGGAGTYDAIQICGSLQGLRLVPSYGAVFANGAVIDTDGLTLCDGEGVGMLHSGAEAHHADLVATGNSNTAIWVQHSNSMFAISGTGSRIADNSFAGLVVLDSSNVSLADATVSTTRLATRLSGEVGTVRVGDGIQLKRSATNIRITALNLDRNERVGLLLDLDGASTSGVTFDGVSVSSQGTALGVVAQSGTLDSGWDTGVARSGAAATNDAAFVSTGTVLDTVEVVAPTDLPAATAVESDGLFALGVVAPTD